MNHTVAMINLPAHTCRKSIQLHVRIYVCTIIDCPRQAITNNVKITILWNSCSDPTSNKKMWMVIIEIIFHGRINKLSVGDNVLHTLLKSNNMSDWIDCEHLNNNNFKRNVSANTFICCLQQRHSLFRSTRHSEYVFTPFLCNVFTLSVSVYRYTPLSHMELYYRCLLILKKKKWRLVFIWEFMSNCRWNNGIRKFRCFHRNHSRLELWIYQKHRKLCILFLSSADVRENISKTFVVVVI